jgi:hypothetical protein
MPRSRVILLSWVVAGAFILATGLVYVDRLNLVATPPDLAAANMVDRALSSLSYRQAIWPVFLWTNLLFGIGFIAAVAFAATVAARLGVGGTSLFVVLAATGGIIAAIASIIPIGAVNAAVWVGYCDCGFKDIEIVSQQWAGMVAEDISDWLNRVASVVLGIGLYAFIRDVGSRISPTLRTWTLVTALALVVAPVLATSSPPGLDEIVIVLTSLIGLILIPVWAVWLGRTVEGSTA